jgi:hypothetical protein
MVPDSAGQEIDRGPQMSSRPGRAILLRAWLVIMLIASIIVLRMMIIPNIVPAPDTGLANGEVVGKDFTLFYSSGLLARAGRAIDAYDDKIMSAMETAVAGVPMSLHWPYPPGMFLVTAAIAGLPYPLALSVWLVVGFGGLAWVAWRLAPHPATPILLALCPTVGLTLIMGQVGLFAAALAGAGLLSLERRPALAGFLFGILTLKLQLAFLLPFGLIAGRHYRALVAMVLTAAVLEIIGLVIAGPDSALIFPHAASVALDKVSTWPTALARAPTVFIAGIYASLPRSLALAIQIAVTLPVIAIVCFIWRRTRSLELRSLAWAAGLPLAVPYMYDYDLPIFVIPLAAIAWRCWHRGISWIDALVMTALWSAPILVKPLALATQFQIPPMIFAGLLVYAWWQTIHPSRESILPYGATRTA